MTKTRLTINALTAASVDIGDPGMPGSGATEVKCKILARRDGRWESVGYYSTGCNQGYYQENYGYGPWTGRGDTPQAAVADMARRADDEHRSAMQRAGHDALLECDDATFASLAAKEADRIEAVLSGDNRAKSALIGTERHFGDADHLDDLRRRAVKMLRRIAESGSSPLAKISDEDLLAEVARRGLTVD